MATLESCLHVDIKNSPKITILAFWSILKQRTTFEGLGCTSKARVSNCGLTGEIILSMFLTCLKGSLTSAHPGIHTQVWFQTELNNSLHISLEKAHSSSGQRKMWLNQAAPVPFPAANFEWLLVLLKKQVNSIVLQKKQFCTFNLGNKHKEKTCKVYVIFK